MSTRAVRGATRRLGLVAMPRPIVPQHTFPISTLGGLAIFAAAASAILVSPIHMRPALVVGACLFAATGVLDDIRELGVGAKVALQTLSASVVAYLGISSPLFGSRPFDAAVAALWLVVVANAVNVTDVCDGLVTGIAIVTFAAIGAIAPDVGSIAFIAAGSCLGFLLLNAPPASIFLGNSGSQLIGFMLGALTLDSVGSTPTWNRVASVPLLVAVFLFEAAVLVVARRNRNLPWWHASDDHFSLRLQAAGWSRWRTVLLTWSAASALALAALLLHHLGGVRAAAVLAVALAAIAGAWSSVTAISASSGMAP